MILTTGQTYIFFCILVLPGFQTFALSHNCAPRLHDLRVFSHLHAPRVPGLRILSHFMLPGFKAYVFHRILVLRGFQTSVFPCIFVPPGSQLGGRFRPRSFSFFMILYTAIMVWAHHIL